MSDKKSSPTDKKTSCCTDDTDESSPTDESFPTNDTNESPTSHCLCLICESTILEPDLEAATVGATGWTTSWSSATKCGHIFHTLCLETWQLSDEENSNKCPKCGKVIESMGIFYAPNFRQPPK